MIEEKLHIAGWLLTHWRVVTGNHNAHFNDVTLSEPAERMASTAK